MEYLMHTDGGSRGNPGPSACAAVLYRRSDPSHLWEDVGITRMYLGDRITNNYAEYFGLLKGVEYVVSLGLHDCTVCVRADSELMVKQMRGEYKFSNLDLLSIAERVRAYTAAKNICLEFEYVPREKNKRADEQVNLELDLVVGKTRRTKYQSTR